MTNKFPGKCECGKAVAAGAGRAVKPAGKWLVLCAGCDLTPRREDFARVRPAPAVKPTPRPLLDGMWLGMSVEKALAETRASIEAWDHAAAWDMGVYQHVWDAHYAALVQRAARLQALIDECA